MKTRLNLLFLIAALPLVATAQDDLYWDPADVVVTVKAAAPPPPPPPSGPYRETLPSYGEDWEDYDYWEDQGYFYSSRIRRFHRPFTGFGYFDPVYSDLGFYDPWMMPGTSIYIGIGGFNDYAYWRRMNRWHWQSDWLAWRGWNTFGYRQFMDPWSFGPWGGYRVYDPWFDPYWGGACFGSSWGWGGFGYGNPVFVNNFYGPNHFYNRPGYWFGNTNGVVDTRPTNQYYGPRSSDARTAPGRGTVRNPEFVGGGIPRLKDAIGTANLQPTGNDVDTGGPGRRPSPASPETRPAAPARDPQPVGEAPGIARPAPSREPATEPAPNRGNVSPARPLNPTEPVRRDPLEGRPSWSDTDKPAPQFERSRDSYREDYIRRREQEARDSGRRDLRERNPRQDNNTYRYDPPATRERQERPAPRQEPRSPRQDSPSWDTPRSAPSRSFDSPSRGTDRPSWNNSAPSPSRGSDAPRGGGSPRRGG